MLTLFESLFLGLIQGLTEWLPISSSGHLVMVQQLFNIQASISFDIFLHAGTLLAVLVFFRKDILDILKSIIRLDFHSPNGKMALFILIATIPIAIAGFFLYNLIVPLFTSLTFTSIALIITGIILYSTRLKPKPSELDSKSALIIGVAQSVSILPGISRSGTTISAALLAGIDRKKAFAFSFLLAIPAIMGANAFELYKAGFQPQVSMEMAAGAAVAAIVGYLSLKLLKRMVVSDKLHLFAYYCWAVGIAVLLLAVA